MTFAQPIQTEERVYPLTSFTAQVPNLERSVVAAGDDFGWFAEKLRGHHLPAVTSQGMLKSEEIEEKRETHLCRKPHNVSSR